MHQVPPRRFFTEGEWRALEAVCHRLIPQPDRPDDPVPIAPWIDEKLYLHKSEGYRYADMPPMETAWRQGLRGIDEDSELRFGRPFQALTEKEQDQVLLAVQQGKAQGEAWSGMSMERFFSSTLLKEIVATYYAHPAAWSEIGFGGPASPRGYARLSADRTDPWEAQQVRGPEGQA
jgi:hypothetical protein